MVSKSVRKSIDDVYPFNLKADIYYMCCSSDEEFFSRVNTTSDDIMDGIDRALELIPKKESFAIINKYKYHKSYKEIGKMVGLTPSGVSGRINQGLRHLRDWEVRSYIDLGLRGGERYLRSVEIENAKISAKRQSESINNVTDNVRALNALYRSGVSTIDKLISTNPDDILDIDNMGKKSFEILLKDMIDRRFIESLQDWKDRSTMTR